MLWFFKDDMYHSSYLFNWLTSAFLIVLAIVQIKNREYWRCFNIDWGFNPDSWYVWPFPPARLTRALNRAFWILKWPQSYLTGIHIFFPRLPV